MSLVRKMVGLALSPALWAFAVKAANALGSFIVTLLVARLAGAEVVGYYTLALTTGTLIAMVPLWGFDQVAMRAVAGDLREGRTGEARGAWRWFLKTVVMIALPLALLFGAAVAFGPVTRWLQADQPAMLAAALGILSVPFYRLVINGIRALGQPVKGQLYEAAPSVLLGLMLLVMAALAIVPTAAFATGMLFGLQLLAVLVALWHFHRHARGWGAPLKPAPEQARRWMIAGMPLMGTAFIHSFTDWFLLASITGFASAAETGAFRVALQIMLIAGVIVATAETYVAPRLAGDMRTGHFDLAWRRHRRATLMMVVLAGPILLLAALFPEYILGPLFGPEFLVAAPALAVMTLGQASNVLTGPIGAMMVMSGNERIQFGLAIAGAVLLVLLTLLLVPRYGLIGAAAGYAGVLLVRNIFSYLLARWLVRPTTSARVLR